jgi:hypothetical protein
LTKLSSLLSHPNANENTKTPKNHKAGDVEGDRQRVAALAQDVAARDSRARHFFAISFDLRFLAISHNSREFFFALFVGCVYSKWQRARKQRLKPRVLVQFFPYLVLSHYRHATMASILGGRPVVPVFVILL